MHKLIEYICDELDELESKASKDHKLSAAEVQYADTLAHLKKNLLTAEAMSDEDYSERPYKYYRGASYARTGGRNAKRDSMGRYSRDYSEAVDDMVSQLRSMMDDAPDEQIRSDINRLISKINKM